MAPGNAPTKTENEVVLFKGVYANTYRSTDKAPKNPQYRLIMNKNNTPKLPMNRDKKKA
jgi:hypothetical protein